MSNQHRHDMTWWLLLTVVGAIKVFHIINISPLVCMFIKIRVIAHHLLYVWTEF